MQRQEVFPTLHLENPDPDCSGINLPRNIITDHKLDTVMKEQFRTWRCKCRFGAQEVVTMMSDDQIHQKIVETVAEEFELEPDQLTPEATLYDDLGLGQPRCR